MPESDQGCYLVVLTLVSVVLIVVWLIENLVLVVTSNAIGDLDRRLNDGIVCCHELEPSG
jgi:hypothetical protein